MFRSSVAAILTGLALVVLLAPQARADKNTVTLTKQWSGSVADEELSKDGPAYIADTKSLEKLWKKWMIEGKVPRVDFKKEIVLVTTTVGSKLSLLATLDDKDNLQVLGMATSDIAPGFRYVIATVSRENVKTINGKEIKDAGKE